MLMPFLLRCSSMYQMQIQLQEILSSLEASTFVKRLKAASRKQGEIAASLNAVQELHHRVHVYWRPHGFGPLFNFAAELTQVFRKAMPASVHILPVYYAGGSVTRRLTAEQFVQQLKAAGIAAYYAADYEQLENELLQQVQPGDAVIGMGARDPQLPVFARHLAEQFRLIHN